MNSAFSSLLGPILVLWIGALIFYVLDRFLEPQDRGVAEATVLALGLGFLFNAYSQANAPIYFGQSLADVDGWGTPPFLIGGRASWLLATIVLGGALMASLASLRRHTAGRSGRLATLGAALLFLFAGDWATLALAWALVDVSLLYTLEGKGARTTRRWTGILSLGGAVVLGVALLLWQQADGSFWVDRSGALPIEATAAIHLPSHVAPLLALAALLRLMPFPLPTWQSAAESEMEDRERPTARVVLTDFVIGTIPVLLGAYLWTRLAQWGVMTQSGRWLSVLPIWGGLALLVGAIKAWGARDPGKLIASANAYGSAIVLLGAGLNLPATWQLIVGVNGVLSVLVLFLSWTQCQYLQSSNPRSYWRIVPTALAVLSLAGLPLTVGFPARVAVYRSIFTSQKWLCLLFVMVTESLLLGALLRIILDVERVSEEQDEGALEDAEDLDADNTQNDERKEYWRREIGYGAGTVLALGLVILGFAPRLLYLEPSLPGLGHWFGLPTLPVWAALFLSIVGAVVLYRYQDVALSLMEEWWPLIQRLLSVDWVYRAVEGVLQRVGALVWGTTQVVEGAGYMAWVVLACLVILLFVIAR